MPVSAITCGRRVSSRASKAGDEAMSISQGRPEMVAGSVRRSSGWRQAAASGELNSRASAAGRRPS